MQDCWKIIPNTYEPQFMTSDHIPSLHLSFFSYFSLVTLVSFFSPTHLAGF